MRTNEKRTLAVEELSPNKRKYLNVVYKLKSIVKGTFTMLVLLLFIGIIGGMEQDSIPMKEGTIASLVCLALLNRLGRSIQKDEI